MAYYYLVASLPVLALDKAPPLARAEFLALCERHLAAADLADLQALLDGRPEQARHPFVRQWREQELQIREVQVRSRAAKLGADGRPFIRETPGLNLTLRQAVGEALAKTNPLERELALDRIRWVLLDDLALWDPFGLSAVLAYALRLTLVWRWAGLTDAAGQARLETLVEQNMAAVQMP